MTATIDFILGQAKNVLRVPNAALRMKPTPEMAQEMMKQFATGQATGQGKRSGAAARAGGRLAAGADGDVRRQPGNNGNGASAQGHRHALVPG